MIWLAAAIASAIIFGLSGFLMKVASHKGQAPTTILLGLYLTGSAAFAFSIFMQHSWHISLTLLCAGAAIGLGSAVGNNFVVRALERGPASLSLPLVNLNVLLIILMSVFIFGETLNIYELIAVSLFLTACVLIPFDPNEQFSIKDRQWYLFIILAIVFIFMRDGGLKITHELGLNNTQILFYGYFMAFVGFSVKYWRNKEQFINARQGIMLGSLAGIFSYTGLALYAFALKSGPASIVAPIFAMRSMVIAVLAIIIFHERLSKFQLLACLAVFSGLILIAYHPK